MKTLIFQHRKWYAVVLFMLTIFANNAWGEANDSIASLKQVTDNVISSTVTSAVTSIPWNTLFLSAFASIIAAIVALFLFFGLLRPRLKVCPLIAYQEVTDEKSKEVKRRCEILVRNKSLFACNDIRAEVSMHHLSDSGDEIRLIIDEPKYLTIAGRLHNENDSNILISFDIVPKRKEDGSMLFPKRVLLEILAQHSLSGIIMPTKKLFTTNDFSEGNYIKSELVEKGKTYKQAVMKSNLKQLKYFSLVIMLLLIIVAVGLFLFTSITPFKLIGVLGMIVLFILCGLTLWQVIVYTRAETFTRNNILHMIRATIIELHQHKHLSSEQDKPATPNAMDVPFEEVTDDKNSKKHLK